MFVELRYIPKGLWTRSWQTKILAPAWYLLSWSGRSSFSEPQFPPGWNSVTAAALERGTGAGEAAQLLPDVRVVPSDQLGFLPPGHSGSWGVGCQELLWIFAAMATLMVLSIVMVLSPPFIHSVCRYEHIVLDSTFYMHFKNKTVHFDNFLFIDINN